jgi:hypothetical protein
MPCPSSKTITYDHQKGARLRRAPAEILAYSTSSLIKEILQQLP